MCTAGTTQSRSRIRKVLSGNDRILQFPCQEESRVIHGSGIQIQETRGQERGVQVNRFQAKDNRCSVGTRKRGTGI